MDWHRIFFGDGPSTFLLEIAFRTSFLFLYSFLLIRLVGKRMMGQLSPFELIVVVALGSSIGGPMMMPNIPLTHGMIVVGTLVFLHTVLGWLKSRFAAFDRIAESPAELIIEGGVIDVRRLQREHVALDEIFMMLRETGVQSLGQVRRAYLETSGHVSVFRYSPDDVRTGLPLSPPPENFTRTEIRELVESATILACAKCGTVVIRPEDSPAPSCVNCQSDRLVPASL